MNGRHQNIIAEEKCVADVEGAMMSQREFVLERPIRLIIKKRSRAHPPNDY